MEVVTALADEPRVVDEQNWLDDVLGFFSDDILGFVSDNWEFIIILVAVVFAGRNAPPELIQRGKDEAAKTETPIDDIVMRVIETLRGGSVADSPLPPKSPDDTKVISDDKPIRKVWLPINDNPNLDQLGENGLYYHERTEGTRKIAIPHHYTYIGEAGSLDGKESAHPDTFYRPGLGFEMALADKAGKFGWIFNLDNFVLAERSRYAIVLKYNAQFKPLTDDEGNATVRLIGQIIHDGNERWALPEKMVLSSTNEAQWVFEVSKDYADLDVLLQVFMPYGAVDDHGTLLIKQIRVVPVPDDYGDDAVIRI